MSKREEGISIAIISEGETESWYFKQLSTAERVHVTPYPREDKSLDSLYDKAVDLIYDRSFDFIFGLVDLDISKNNKTKLQKLNSLSKKSNNFYVVRSQPCFEYWFYLHSGKYSSRYFSTWKNEDPLKPEIKKIIDEFTLKTFQYSSQNTLHKVMIKY